MDFIDTLTISILVWHKKIGNKMINFKGTTIYFRLLNSIQQLFYNK